MHDNRPNLLRVSLAGEFLLRREGANNLGGNVEEEDGGDERECKNNDNEGVTERSATAHP
jgi:hypothetical protein